MDVHVIEHRNTQESAKPYQISRVGKTFKGQITTDDIEHGSTPYGKAQLYEGLFWAWSGFSLSLFDFVASFSHHPTIQGPRNLIEMCGTGDVVGEYGRGWLNNMGEQKFSPEIHLAYFVTVHLVPGCVP